jgi:hypothetical protein
VNSFPLQTTKRSSRDLQPGPGRQGSSIGASEADPGAGGGDVEEAGEGQASRDYVSQPGSEKSSISPPRWESVKFPHCTGGGTGTQRHERYRVWPETRLFSQDAFLRALHCYVLFHKYMCLGQRTPSCIRPLESLYPLSLSVLG